MTAKKKTTRKVKQKAPNLTAVKLVVMRAGTAEKEDGSPAFPKNLHRYVITGMLVTAKPLPNIPNNSQIDHVLEATGYVEADWMTSTQFMEVLAALPERKANFQGGDATQKILNLKKI